MPDETTQNAASVTEPLWDATFRARLLRQGLSTDEMAQVVELAEQMHAASTTEDVLLDAILDSLDVLDNVTVPSRSMGPAEKCEFVKATLVESLTKRARVRRA